MLKSIAIVVAMGGVAAANPHKKIDKNDIGNCIFSTGELPKDKFDQWKPATSFKPGDSIFMRCFFSKSVKEFAKEGKLRNTLRAPLEATVAGQAAGPAWRAELNWSDDKEHWYSRLRMPYVESDTGHWLEERFDQPAGAGTDKCDFKNSTGDACTDLTAETQNLGKKVGKTGKYKAQICLDVYFDKVDKTKVVGNKEVDIAEYRLMAHGCFDYTVDL